MKWAIALLALGILGGCHDMTAPDSEAREQSLEADTVDPAISAADQLERAQKKAWREGKPVKQHLDWAAAASQARVRAQVASQAAAALSDVPLPVLLPDDPLLLGSAFATVGPTWYTTRMRGDGVTVFVKGTSAAFVHGKVLTAEERASIGQFQISRAHHIVTLAIMRFGAAYTIDVECAEPTTDPRCQRNDYVLQLADSLGRAGGRP